MPYQPRSQDQIYTALKGRIVDKTVKLTNFSPGSLNHTLTYYGWSGFWYRYEHALLAVQLSSWVDHAGGPHTKSSLQKLDLPNLDAIDFDLLNNLTDPRDLDQIGVEQGVFRDPGSYARGEVLFVTEDDGVVIDKGTIVTTEPDRYGEFYEYETTEGGEVPSGEGSILLPVKATERGSEQNVGPSQIKNISGDATGVKRVTNPESVTGGAGVERNDEYRKRIKTAIFRNSGGGTEHGIIGGLENNIDGVDEGDVSIVPVWNPDPSTSPFGNDYPYGRVVVDGGDPDLVEEEIDRLAPVLSQLHYEQPTEYIVDAKIEIEGESVNVDRVKGALNEYLSRLGLGGEVRRSLIFALIHNADERVDDVPTLELSTQQTGAFYGNFQLNSDEIVNPGTFDITVSA